MRGFVTGVFAGVAAVLVVRVAYASGRMHGYLEAKGLSWDQVLAALTFLNRETILRLEEIVARIDSPAADTGDGGERQENEAQ